MRQKFILLAAWVLSCNAYAVEFRIATQNIWLGLSRGYDLESATYINDPDSNLSGMSAYFKEIVQDKKPSIIALQEVDRFAERSNNVNTLQAINDYLSPGWVNIFAKTISLPARVNMAMLFYQISLLLIV